MIAHAYKRSRVTLSSTRKPSGRHSRSILPPSCLLATRSSWLPNPSSFGPSPSGSQRSSQTSVTISSSTTDLIVTVPEGDAKAPYLAALVASS